MAFSAPRPSLALQERVLPELLPHNDALVTFAPALYCTGDWWRLPDVRLAVCVGDLIYVYEGAVGVGTEGREG
jgi:hypothetical protein